MELNNDALDKEIAAEDSSNLLDKALASVDPQKVADVSNVQATPPPTDAKTDGPQKELANPKPPTHVRNFEHPDFWKAWYNTIDSSIKSGRIPKIFVISTARAQKFLDLAKANFKDFEEKEIKSLDDLSFNIISEDGKTKFTLYVISSDFIVDPPGRDGGQFL